MLVCSLEVSKEKCQLLLQLALDVIDWPDLTSYSWDTEAENSKLWLKQQIPGIPFSG